MAIVLPKFSSRRSAGQYAPEAESALSISFCRPDARYVGGDLLRCCWQIRQVPTEQVLGVETSVLWYTEGKGEEDLQVHHFERLSAGDVAGRDLSEDQPFTTRLPYSPLSYDGELLRIRWCARLRIFLPHGDQLMAQQLFCLTAPLC